MASRSRGGVGCRPDQEYYHQQIAGGRRKSSNLGKRPAADPSSTLRAKARATGQPDPWLCGRAPAVTTALDMSRDETRLDRLSFGCTNLDAAFQGGVPVQGITEIAGEAGAGKTQLCLQLLLQAQLAPEKGGLGGKSYVLTCGEGDFPSRRLRQMATRFQKRHGVEPLKLMEGVCIQNARNLDDQMKILMEHLPVLMKSHRIKLVVVDSIAALFRSDLGRGRSDIGQRSRLLGQLSQQMKRLGDRHRATFVVVNQVTGKVSGSPTGGSGGNVPAMGLLWSQCINTRFMVRRRDFRLPLRPSNMSQNGAEARRSDPYACPSHATRECMPSASDESSTDIDGDRSSRGSGAQSDRERRSSAESLGRTGAGSPQATTVTAREMTLIMSPCTPVGVTACGFLIERDGVTGVGR